MNQMNQEDDRTMMPEGVQEALNPDAQRVGGSANDPYMVIDPVCGTRVDTRAATNTLPAPVNMPMATLYFCSPECKATFEADPQKYGSDF